MLLDKDGYLKVTDLRLSAFSEHLKQDGLLYQSRYLVYGEILYVLLDGFLTFQDDNLVAMHRKIYRGDFKCPMFKKSIPGTVRSKQEIEFEAFNGDKSPKPETLKAFHIISLTQGFNLSLLFEVKKREEKRAEIAGSRTWEEDGKKTRVI
ncbi:hypothetical protein V6N12_062542 [Hibiscus sabdariffa]|uniref:non-specific serine/threonine protein kinase n=1 Tax=Hibiscus sabdariffa TaxID=183260 RepID=A0ABR2F958_9ROSI